MDIDYHYYVIKTLAHAAGFSEEDAQTVAYYSQQVDDFTRYITMRVRQKPPAFFIDNGYAEQSMEAWLVKPHPTGIDVIQSLSDSYRRAEMVLGSAELLKQNAQMLKEEQPLLLMGNPTTYNDEWEPKSELALAVYTAGFEYHPDKDIICSTMNNVQRLGGYCKGYDEAAVSINSIIDSEPFYFAYDGYEWMIELWKGQYGIETGCEIGVYYREQGKPLSMAEKTLMGKLYACVPDDRLLDLRFTLKKGDEQLFERDWTKHWWLTGFRWGVMSEPEQLVMTAGIRFPNSDMRQAFVHQGLESLGYTYTQTDDVSVEFCFAKPKTAQPAARASMRQSEQEVNKWLVKTYNAVRTKYGITVNDPNVIERALLSRAGAEEKILYEALVKHYSRKAEHKDNMQKGSYS